MPIFANFSLFSLVFYWNIPRCEVNQHSKSVEGIQNSACLAGKLKLIMKHLIRNINQSKNLSVLLH